MANTKASESVDAVKIDLSVIDALFDEATELLYRTKIPRGDNPHIKSLFKQMMDKVKASLTSNDRQLILVYFRWLTRRGAKRMGITSLTRTASLSEETMNWLKSEGLADVVDWQFTGMTYHGANSCVCCSHGGHRLQYAYHAYSPTAKKSLIFGSQCGSEFFQVDLASLGKLGSLVDNAKHELAFVLARGRASESFVHSEIYNVFNVMRRFPDLARYCVQYTGQSTFELVSNFISCGFFPPASLASSFTDGYCAAVHMFLQSKGLPSNILELCDETRRNEITVSAVGYRNNTGVVPLNNLSDKPHEFLYPLSSAGFADAVRASFLLEAYSPTSFSGYYNLLDAYAQFNKLVDKAKSLGYNPSCSTARLIYNYSFKTGACPFKDINSVIAYSLLSDDLRITLYMMGLTPNSHRLVEGSIQSSDLRALNLYASSKMERMGFTSGTIKVADVSGLSSSVSSLKAAKDAIADDSAYDVDFEEEDVEIMQSSVLRATNAKGERAYDYRFGVYKDCRFPANAIKVDDKGYYIPNVFDYCWLSGSSGGSSNTRIAYSLNCPKRELLLTYIMQNYDAIDAAITEVAGVELSNNSAVFASEVGTTQDAWNFSQDELDMEDDEEYESLVDDEPLDDEVDEADFDDFDDDDMDLDSEEGDE